MLKQLVLGMAIATAASVSFAAGTNDCFSGLYAGAGVKYTNSADKFNIKGDKKSTTVFAENPGFAGNLFLGYGRVLTNSFYLGGEAYGDLGYREQAVDAKLENESDLTIKTKYQLGLMAKLGYVVTPQTLVYAGLGAENAKFDLATEKYNKWAFAPSVGMDLALNSNLQVGARYTYANYRDIELGNATYKPARNTFGLNVTYRFASL
ncbi:MAG: hypothetical protein K0S11_1013 [Gammaproteobacteria bacterium]|jgi:outer membrane immunogenic protein|nr:hypothetical protein [Gammaproteobacteria bacterium]